MTTRVHAQGCVCVCVCMRRTGCGSSEGSSALGWLMCRDAELCWPAVADSGGDVPLFAAVAAAAAAADVAKAVIKLCLHLSLTSAGGWLQQQGAPDSQTTSLLLLTVEHS